ncbi:hypothetical protein DMN91_008023 [Ooceraea biroi]|uniref:GTP-binding protein n=1 Tax=Ooceraea biroi TaxID=2015173 RepID=A0A3L8DGM7_OOCBI|nr:GTP-binding protein 10 homolog [Ooceraea biroi]RLU19466.1 hypothetical protein DMN91_008023 [Ooceraea biroi]
MVLLTPVLGCVKKLPRKYLRSKFIDTLRIRVTGGTGGSGLPRYGGLGGAGGNVYFVAKDRLLLENVAKTLKIKQVKADAGKDSNKRGIIGVPGQDKTISVPCGVMVYNENGVLLGELNKEDSKLLVAKGGKGGCEQTGYCGVKGESQTVKLDLKLIADVGLVGFPNAGKSTFLAAVSSAKPKIANYPFTTIRPRLGIMNYMDYRRITVADLPGLIEGAHLNIGMGHNFLKHVERTKLLLFIVDVQGFQLSAKHMRRSCLETVVLLNKEIELYKPDLLKMPTAIIINKMDTDNADGILEEIKPMLENLSEYVATCPEEIQPNQVVRFDDILSASLIMKNDREITTIKERIRDILDKYEEQQHVAVNGDSLDSQLVERIKRQTERQAPTVV